MTFSFFGPPSTNDIRVGYISTDRGYVTGVDICEANSYAKKNPGTIFIFRNGNNDYQYLTINQVNKLTPSDLSNTTEKCGGLKAQKECGPPRIQIFGGGGVGAAGNPVVGIDGSILAVDLIRSGHGYQYPPLATAIDDCQYGSGIILRTVLGEEAGTEEVFDREEDFENYEICDDSTIGFGTKYGSNGEDLGPWNPDLYSSVTEDPIRREIENYLEDLKKLKNPFWTTRNRQPNSITALGRRYPTAYNVTFPQWNDFMNQYAISPVSPSNVRGSDEAGKVFSFEWVEEFPFDGQYTFRGLCDNSAQLYVNDEKIFDLGGFKDAVRPTQKYFKSGVYKIKIDLLNLRLSEKLVSIPQPQPQQPSNFVEVDFKVSGDGRNTSAINFAFSSVDGSHSFVIRSVNKSGQNKTEKIKVKPNTKYKVIATSTKGPVEQGTLSGSKKNKEGGLGNSNSIFADHIESNNDNNDMRITCSSGTFTASEKSTVPNSGRSTFKLNYSVSSDGQQTTSSTSIQVISPKSWNENPMGISVIIDAPKPPPLKETPPIQEGRCPNNPIWSTRFPSSSENWYPVRHPAWADFFNRYAISPIIPSNLPGSDGSGIVYKNSWEVEIPYRGYYQFQAQRDNTARIYLDGNLVFDITTSGDVLWVGNGLINKVKGKKVLIEKGRHTISVEVENTPQETTTTTEKKIFSTKDWQAPLPQTEEQRAGSLFVKEGNSYYMLAGGNDVVDISFTFDWNDSPYIAGTAVTKIVIPTESGGPLVFNRPSGSQTGSTSGKGTFKANKKYGPILFEGRAPGSPSPTIVNTGPNPDQKDQRINFFDADGTDVNAKLTATNAKQLSGARTSTPTQPTSQGGVTYSGPPLFNYKEKRWSSFMNEYGISPKVFKNISEKEIVNIGKWDLVWDNVDFPEDGEYDIRFQGDNVAILKIGGREIQTTTNFIGESNVFRANITKGKYKVEVNLENIRTPRVEDKKDKSLEFSSNPYGVSLHITKNVKKSITGQTSWFTNPVGIGAVLVPPPCPKKTGGKGIVDKIIVQDPGNGYLPPANVNEGPGYPVTLQLTEVIVDNPGINYNCGVDQIRITPSNGAVLDYTCDSFGKIREVKVLNPGTGFVEYPIIEIVSPPDSPTGPTGVNASFIPVFEVVRDPIETPPEKLIQVTDLVGLKQTGYVDGRPYYGAVYYEDGAKFAGYFKTIGTPVQVYDTLQESIAGRVTARPSAIQRSGTDVTSNDSRLNIPGTPENLI